MAAASKTAADQVIVPAPVPGRSSDWDAPNLGWTSQSGVKFENTDPIPGQVFVQAQLPDPAAQVAAGIDPATSNAGLVVLTPEEAAKHPGGPEADDRLGGTAVYEGTINAGTATAPDAFDTAPATASTVDNVPA
uniref:Uncharacterized protein n=1 Tax=Streptomyces sp. NBC_01393 TaxID=2903851 RepID=A0AAU3IA80_9ACTN